VLTGLVVAVGLVARVLRSTSWRSTIVARWRTSRRSTTPRSRRCQWMLPTSSKVGRSPLPNPSPSALRLYYYPHHQLSSSFTIITTTNTVHFVGRVFCAVHHASWFVLQPRHDVLGASSTLDVPRQTVCALNQLPEFIFFRFVHVVVVVKVFDFKQESCETWNLIDFQPYPAYEMNIVCIVGFC